MSYAELLDVFKIVNHAHAVFDSIPLIQMVQAGAREGVTIEAVLDSIFSSLLAVLDLTCDTGFWFVAVVAQTTGACLLISCICNAEATVHSTGGDECRTNRPCNVDFSATMHPANHRFIRCIF